MKVCSYRNCYLEITSINPKTAFCSDKCRVYENRLLRKIEIDDYTYIIGKDGIKRRLTNSLILSMAKAISSNEVNIPSKLENNYTKVDDEIPMELDDVVPSEKIDYQKVFNDCEFEDEYRNLWNKINDDASMPSKEKLLWKIRLNVK